jgi:hypothetical protein
VRPTEASDPKAKTSIELPHRADSEKVLEYPV